MYETLITKKTQREYQTVSVVLFIILCLISSMNYSLYNSFSVAVANTVSKNLTLSKSKITLGIGETYTLTAKENKNVIWTSNNSSAVTVDNKGKITAKRVGTAIITATSGSSKGNCSVTVKEEPKYLSLNKSKLTLGIGEVYDLNLVLSKEYASYHVTYKSFNTDIAEVTAAGGFVTAKSEGTAVITAVTYNNKSTNCIVTVKKAPDKVYLNKGSLKLGIGETFDLNSSLPIGTAAHKIVYTSNNSNIASVKSAGGLVTAKSRGTALITATTYNGKKAYCTITVKKAPSYVSLDKTTLNILVGETYDFTSSVPKDCAAYHIKYTSENPFCMKKSILMVYIIEKRIRKKLECLHLLNLDVCLRLAE